MTFVFGAALLAGEISARWGANLWPADWAIWVQLPLLLFIADGLDYGRHRLQHTVSWLWPMHVLHHDVDRMNVLKSGRGHFLDMLFRSLAVYAPLALMGVPASLMLVYAAAISVFGPVAHANVSLPVPSFMHRVFMTPQFHRIHHARPLALSCSNYCNIFPIWDLMFGTFTSPEEHSFFEYGVEDSTQPDDFLGQVLAPAESWRGAGREAASASVIRRPAPSETLRCP
ncbi:MAG: sterol desaturase family protein [Deltaproteobacteria bacterium]|nr:sterol desaturase family protein [Deltaproteobacteria bacterium]MBW2396295.1 sterol desaturase family protein [Deltaproteobacteria bacterium]